MGAVTVGYKCHCSWHLASGGQWLGIGWPPCRGGGVGTWPWRGGGVPPPLPPPPADARAPRALGDEPTDTLQGRGGRPRTPRAERMERMEKKLGRGEQREVTGQGRPRLPKTVQSAEGGEGKDKRKRINVVVRSPCQENDPADTHPSAHKSVLESAKPTWTRSVVHVNALGQRHGQQPVSGMADPRVVKQDKSSGGSFDTTRTRSGPQRVRMSSCERPIGTATGKQSDTEALCQTPPSLPMHPCPPPPPL